MTSREPREPDFVGYEFEEYRDVPCDKCGETEKQLEVTTNCCHVTLYLTCLHCGLTNNFSGTIDPRSQNL